MIKPFVILVFAIILPGVFHYTYASDLLPEDLDISQLSNHNFTIDDIKTLVKKKCENITSDDSAYENIETGATTLMDCISKIFNATEIQNEIHTARPQGELDAVFNKYCLKRPEAVTCVDGFIKTLEPCLDQEEKKSSDVFLRVTKSLLSFICHKGGDQIALFIAEKGPECLEQNKEVISNCMNTTFSDYIPKNLSNPLLSLPQFLIGPKQCKEIYDFEKCVVNALEKCSEITPANIVQSMFKFVKNETMCPLEIKAQKMGSTATNLQTISTGVFLPSIFVITMSYFLHL